MMRHTHPGLEKQRDLGHPASFLWTLTWETNIHSRPCTFKPSLLTSTANVVDHPHEFPRFDCLNPRIIHSVALVAIHHAECDV
jgi:hypothetical protein